MDRRSFLKGLLAVGATIAVAPKTIYAKTVEYFRPAPHPAVLVHHAGYVTPEFARSLRSKKSASISSDSWIMDELLASKGHPNEARLRAMVDYIVDDERANKRNLPHV